MQPKARAERVENTQAIPHFIGSERVPIIVGRALTGSIFTFGGIFWSHLRIPPSSRRARAQSAKQITNRTEE